jgi:hypothetical protein
VIIARRSRKNKDHRIGVPAQGRIGEKPSSQEDKILIAVLQ